MTTVEPVFLVLMETITVCSGGFVEPIGTEDVFPWAQSVLDSWCSQLGCGVDVNIVSFCMVSLLLEVILSPVHYPLVKCT